MGIRYTHITQSPCNASSGVYNNNNIPRRIITETTLTSVYYVAHLDLRSTIPSCYFSNFVTRYGYILQSTRIRAGYTIYLGAHQPESCRNTKDAANDVSHSVLTQFFALTTLSGWCCRAECCRSEKCCVKSAHGETPTEPARCALPLDDRLAHRAWLYSNIRSCTLCCE